MVLTRPLRNRTARRLPNPQQFIPNQIMVVGGRGCVSTATADFELDEDEGVISTSEKGVAVDRMNHLNFFSSFSTMTLGEGLTHGDPILGSLENIERVSRAICKTKSGGNGPGVDIQILKLDSGQKVYCKY